MTERASVWNGRSKHCRTIAIALPALKMETVQQPFAGKVFGVTGNLDRDALYEMIKLAGGQISNTVHKRVSYLVCTEEALRRNTQRVRKAQKLNVIIVSPDFVHEAVKLRTLPDHDLFQVKPPEKKRNGSSENREVEVQSATSDDEELTSSSRKRKLDK